MELKSMDNESTQYIGQELSGDDFNNIFKHITFIKLTNETENHNGFQFVDGLNIDILPFDTTYGCSPGGIYFTDIENAHMWIEYGADTMYHMRYVIIPNDARVYVEADKFKTDKLILSPKYHINNNIYMRMIERDRNKIKYIPEFIINKLVDKKFCSAAVKQNGMILKYIPKELIDKKICVSAVKQNGNALKYVPDTYKNKQMYMIAKQTYISPDILNDTNTLITNVITILPIIMICVIGLLHR